MGNKKGGDLPEFDELLKLAKEDPEGLEQLRKDLSNELIESAPEASQRKLRGLQFKIDMEREKAKTPMAACIRISEMMHDSFSELRDTIKEVQTNHINQLRTLTNSGAKQEHPIRKHNPTVAKAKPSALMNKVEEKIAEKSAKIFEFPAG